MFPTVLVMLGLDHKDADILEAIASGAAKLGASRVLVAHIHNRDPVPAPLVGLVQVAEPPRPEALDTAVATLAERLPGISVEGVYRSGPPEFVLAGLTEEFDVDLFVMGRDKAEGDKAGWGSASRKILRQTTCSALVVPAGSRLDLARVVVGLDFSQYSTMALAVACQVADKSVAVYQYDAKVPAPGGRKQAGFKAQVEQAARDHLSREVMPWLKDGCEPDLVVHGGGRVAEVLLGHAGSSPIIMGSRGLTPLAALLLGSSADRVAGRCSGPVLVVRKKGSTLGILERLVHKN